MNSNDNGMYWQSLEELAHAPKFQDAMVQEFAEEVEAGTLDGPTRRHFMGVVGASAALAGLSGCVRRPEQVIVPYAKAPEDVLPGVAQRYATVTHVGHQVVGLLVESHEGRPTKIEGNPDHPASFGGASAMHQALVLDLYEPNRLRQPRQGGESVAWSVGEKALREHFASLRAGAKGEGIAVLTESTPSPTFYNLRERFLATYPGAKWYTYEAVNQENQRVGLMAAFGKPVRPEYRLSKTSVVIALDSDFLGSEGDMVVNAAGWAATRQVHKPGDEMSRLYAVEADHSLTGSNADHRLRTHHAGVEAVAWGLVGALTKRGVALNAELVSAATAGAAGLDEKAKKYVEAMADDLAIRQTAKGGARNALVLVGDRQPPVVHAIAAAINTQVGRGAVYYFKDYSRPAESAGDVADLKALVAQLNGGGVHTLLTLGGNPAYNAPADLGFAAAMKKAKLSISLADQIDETSTLATWVFPKAHFLEAWGDLVHTNGVAAIQQPLIAPLHGGWSALDLLGRTLDSKVETGYELVRGFWRGQQRRKDNFEKRWRRWLHDGVLSRPVFGTLGRAQIGSTGLGGLKASGGKKPSTAALDVVFHVDPHMFDGRFANNSWLQEAPDPMTKVSWDNTALLSPVTAKALNVKSEDKITLTVGQNTVEGVAWVLPGLADDTVVVSVGYGREFGNFLPHHDKGVVGFDVNPLRTSAQPNVATGGTLSGTGEATTLACVQRYSRLEPGYGYPERQLVRERSLEEFQKEPDFAKPGIIIHGEAPPKKDVIHPPQKSLYGDFDYSKGYQWGMVIDLNACTGCNACLVACVAENNIMPVGKDEVRRGRELHWIRMDRYFKGDENDPQVVHQPMACQQCETAPCENVCPVAATTHSPEGLNDMAYNRCIGTRYCANNCPFKVRRFNFYNYSKGQDNLLQMARNPNVTVRFRGVMEKCTYCVQRINLGKRTAKMANGPEDQKAAIDNITPACGQSCPTGAIVFGDINDKTSAVSKARARDRNYGLLTELNLRPRTSYLAKVRNLNPKLAG